MAKSKGNQVSITKMNRIIEDQKKDIYIMKYTTNDNNEIEIEVNNTISLSDAIGFVEDVVSGVFIDNENEIKYAPVLKSLNINYAILKYYTNCKVNMDADKLYNFIVNTDIIERIYVLINTEQIDELIRSIDDSIDYKKQEILSNQKSMLEQNIKIINKYVDILSTFNAQFEGINPDEVLKMINNLSGLDSNEIAKNAVNNIINFTDKE